MRCHAYPLTPRVYQPGSDAVRETSGWSEWPSKRTKSDKVRRAQAEQLEAGFEEGVQVAVRSKPFSQRRLFYAYHWWELKAFHVPPSKFVIAKPMQLHQAFYARSLSS